MAKGVGSVEDKELVERIAQKDEEAMMTFYNRYFGLVAGYCRQVISAREVADEVIQDTFWQVWRDASRYNPGRASPRTWLLTMARSRAVDRLRQLARAPASESLDSLPTPPSDPVQVADQVVAREMIEALTQGLARIPEEQRHMIEWIYMRGLTAEQSALQANIPLGTAKTRLRLGLDKLRRILEVEPHDA